MATRPGGALAARPLHFIWMCDCSGSMSEDDKMTTLNRAIRESLPDMNAVADENPNANVLIHTLKFSHGAQWHTPEPVPLHQFSWQDLAADPLQKNTVNADIIFLMDTSGSMNDEINAVKRSCSEFADHIIKQGANVRLGLIGFGIGNHNRSGTPTQYTVQKLSTYTIGTFELTTPARFKENIETLKLGLFGGGGCYLANPDTVDIFPHIVRAFDKRPTEEPTTASGSNARILVIISDEIGNTEGVAEIVKLLNKASITTHVLGVPKEPGAHQQIAHQTGGTFWSITQTKGVQDFSTLLGTVAETIAREVTKKMSDGTVSAGTDMGAAMRLLANHLKIPPMPERALPPVLVLVSDGQPTDDFADGLQALMAQPWGKKAVRIAIGIGADADLDVLQQFIGHSELHPLKAGHPQALVKYIKWVSTAVLKSASAPASHMKGERMQGVNVPVPALPDAGGPDTVNDVW